MVKKLAFLSAVIILSGGGTLLFGDGVDCDIFIYDGTITAGLDPAILFSQEMQDGLRRGFPLHIDLEVELKESMPAWFDPVHKKYQAKIEIEYRAFGSRYYMRVVSFDGSPHESSSRNFDDLIADLKDFLIISAGKYDQYRPEKNLYFRFNLKLRRLTAKELSRASDWYRGKEPDRSDSLENKKGVPDRIFEQLLDISGLGPTRYSIQSRIFRPADLRNLRP